MTAARITALDRKKLELAKLRARHKQRLRLAFDGNNPEAAATDDQQSVLQSDEHLIHWIVAANRSGKSQTGARIVSWWFAENHPHMERPAEWGSGPLQILVVGRLGEQMESELWTQKIKPFLRDGTYKAVRIGNILQRVENLKNGNRIVFLSHHDALHAREKVQAFTAHIVWLDEMPDHAGLVTELVMRTLTQKGRMYATFTPLVRNEEIRKIVDSPAPGTKRFQFKMLDNPIFKGRESEIEAQVRAACSSDAEFRARMYGEWYYGSTRVFSYDRSKNMVQLPDGYEKTEWRHLALVDPSASGHTGLTVWAEHPDTGDWFNVVAKYLQGDAAYNLLDTVERELVGYRVVERWCDCNPAGFYREAARRGIAWRPFTDKSDRKIETIDKVNSAWLQTKVWLTPGSHLLEDELLKAEWADKSADRIVNASSYHLCDTLRYFVDVMPKFNPEASVTRTQSQQIRDAWKSRKVKEEQEIQRKVQIAQRRSKWWKPKSWSQSLYLVR